MGMKGGSMGMKGGFHGHEGDILPLSGSHDI